MTEPQALLRLLAWLSPAFPTGGFAYSHGLEWAVQAGDLRDGDSLRDWLNDVLTHGSGRSDAILLRHAHRSWDDAAALAGIAELARAVAPSRERRMEAVAQGAAFGLAAGAWFSTPSPPHSSCPGLTRASLAGTTVSPVQADCRVKPGNDGNSETPYPVAVGALTGAHGMPEHSAALAYLHALTANLISAGVRLIPLGQSTGLTVLAALEPTLLSIAGDTRDAPLDDVGGCTFRADISSMRHETQYTRLFRS